MNPWLVLLGLLILAALFVVAPVAGATFAHWRRPRRVECPVERTEARVRIDAGQAALGSIVGRRALEIIRCSLWPRLAGCRQACLEAGTPANTTPRRSPQRAPLRTILVPLDGSPGSESVLWTVGELARAQGARVRLLRVADAVSSVWTPGRVVTYADQETARVEQEEIGYLRRVAAGLPEVPVDTVVRFGDPVAEIVEEAEVWGADLIAMATHQRAGLARVIKGSIAERVERGTTIPVVLVPHGELAYV